VAQSGRRQTSVPRQNVLHFELRLSGPGALRIPSVRRTRRETVALSKKEDPAHDGLFEYHLLPHQRYGELTAGILVKHRERRDRPRTAVLPHLR
jgi:hypothetical protein